MAERPQQRPGEFGSSSNRPCNRRPSVTTPAQDLHIRLLHLRDHLRPATQTVDETVGLDNLRISAQTVRNRLREAHLHARRPHQGLDLTAVQRRNRLLWANAHLRWPLAHWRSVLFTLQLYRAESVYGIVWASGLLMSML
uniref:Transposase Tc1-like domain-containing protein n=1 Tax=Hucho hucho TaxID=62062 RepID=A0A4W5QAV8_9TELE